MSAAWPEHLSGFRLEHHAHLPSTQVRGAELARGGDAPAVVVADLQTAGRGRMTRSWTSPLGNLYASIVLQPAFAASLAPSFSLAVAVAVARAIEDLAAEPLAVGLKWPNDVLCAEAKVAGILIEAVDGHLVIGMGVNVAVAPEGAAGATSLAAQGLVVAPRELLRRVLDWIGRADRELADGRFGDWRGEWLARAAWLDHEVRVQLADRAIVGILRGVDDVGALQIETPRGVETVVAGDVERVRLGDTG